MSDKYEVADNGFINLIQLRRGGDLEAELDRELKRVVAHTRRTGGTSKLSLTISIKATEFEGGFGVGHALKVSLAKEKINDDLMWADKESGLRDHSVDQGDLLEGTRPALTPAPTKVSPLNRA